MRTATFPALLQRFFTDRLCVQMEASRHTIASYRDTFRLLIRYGSDRLKKAPSELTIEELDDHRQRAVEPQPVLQHRLPAGEVAASPPIRSSATVPVRRVIRPLTRNRVASTVMWCAA